jgi:hypothetical protein
MRYLWLILLLWQPIGRIHQVWYLYLKGVTLKEILTKIMYRIMLLESGLLGPFTPFVNKRWRNKQGKHKKGLTANTQMYPIKTAAEQ